MCFKAFMMQLYCLWLEKSNMNVMLLYVQLQDKATLLTAERKKRGKTIPEGLASAEDIRGYHQVASHVVCC